MQTAVIETRVLAAQPTAVRRAVLRQADLAVWFVGAFGEVSEFLRRRGIRAYGFPFARFQAWSDDRLEVEAGFPVAVPVVSDGQAQASELPSGPAAVTLYVGPGDKIGTAYALLADWFHVHGGHPAGDAWEIYHDPPTGEPAHRRIEIIQPYLPTWI
jgi:effector-binding domain-containing protein